MYFKVKVSFYKRDEKGEDSKVKESLLVNTETFSSAEKATYECLSNIANISNIMVEAMSIIKLDRLIEHTFIEDNKCFKVVLCNQYIDDKGKLKKEKYIVYVVSSSIEAANKDAIEASGEEFNVFSTTETDISDYIKVV